jgi:hypothetical protein
VIVGGVVGFLIWFNITPSATRAVTPRGSYCHPVSRRAKNAANVRGSLTWAKPAPKTGTDVPVAIAGAPL